MHGGPYRTRAPGAREPTTLDREALVVLAVALIGFSIPLVAVVLGVAVSGPVLGIALVALIVIVRLGVATLREARVTRASRRRTLGE
ncbi:hypothetical protein [Sandaracinus amylolyticus]|uniref:hypothetical protein n=1 Tax=Sandaracinus amylolyticus TaxID=927083 RepID=UPI001F3943AC|nr:hypothetical protein [Sandaracinus amylolyticus]UJR85654.1 Hypothetical protein I5071_77340 [Sandaracinus amylolyticus]